MILECPECHNRYLVPDKAIGVAGRTVRCANCRHSWFQEGAAPSPFVLEQQSPAPVAVPDDIPAPIEAFPQAEPERYDAFAHEPPVRPRRNPARRWTAAAVAAGVLMLAGVGIILWSSAPGILQQIGLPIGPQNRRFAWSTIRSSARDLTNGSELFAVSGKVLNPSGTRQRVPDIRADLRDASGRDRLLLDDHAAATDAGAEKRDRFQLGEARCPRHLEAGWNELRG